ncbi:MAG: aspartate kinase [Polyangiaceae bacterium]|nr:aspartate kinase [Polyangiaceae bacterium]
MAGAACAPRHKERKRVQSAERPRPVVVQKYGGSSVADVEKIGRVADLVVATKAAGNDVVVVVSAMGKTTDSLLGLAHSVTEVGGGRSEPARRELDMLVSTGERVSMSLLSIAIQARGYHAISFTGSQSGILTNDRHFDARIIEVRPHRIEDELSRGAIVIVAGYQGMSYKREITTLGRGGSDTTAVALAAALGADRCEIYSDVDGVYSADPRVVPDAKHLSELDHAMLQEMAEAGAKVVCAQAVEWARKRNIIIHARSTYDPARQTVVVPAGDARVQRARAVTGEGKIFFTTWRGVPSARAVSALERAGLPYKDLSITGDHGSAIIPLLNLPSPDKAREALARALPEIQVSEDVASVSVVGDGLAGDGAALARFLSALESASAAPSAICAGPLRLTAVVAAARANDAQRALHAALVA